MTIEKILLEYDSEKPNLLPALKKISAVFGYVSEENAQKTADYFSVPLNKVFETASFYDLVNIKKQPEIVIQVCSSANCAVNGSFEIIRELESALKIKCGDDSNLKIKLETVSCLGQCADGSIMVVNGTVYERVTKSSIHSILAEYI